MVILRNVIDVPRRLTTHVSVFAVLQEAKIHKTAAVCFKVRFYRSRLWRYSYIGANSFVCDADIGSFCCIAENCCIGGASHPIKYVSMSPAFYRRNIMKKCFFETDFKPYARTKIGNDVWIGYGVMIRAGVNIADGAVIGMGSVLTKDVGPYEIWAGNPARMIGKRFEDERIARLLKIRWWNWSKAHLCRRAPDFVDVDRFVEGCQR